MEQENQSEKIRQGFTDEFTSAQDARSKLHENFSEQGIRIVEQRRKIMELLITISAGFIATPKIFSIDILNHLFYEIGLLVLVVLIILIMFHLRESVDEEESDTISLRNKLLGVLDRRINKLREYLSKKSFDGNDVASYREYRTAEDNSDDILKQQEKNQNQIDTTKKDRINYPSAFFLLLFISGAFLILCSVLAPGLQLIYITLIEIIFVLITSVRFAGKLIGIYRNIVSYFKK